MKLPHLSALALVLGLALVSATSSCRPRVDAADQPVSATPHPAAAVVAEPTAARLSQRSLERWNKVAKGDLIAAYDYSVPERKHEEPLSKFLGRLEKHKYENPRVDEVVAVQDKLGYVRCTVLWTSLDEMTKRVKLAPGETLTQEISMIETWRFVDGDWCYVRPENEADFFQEHPELLKQDGQATAQPTPAPADAKH